METLIDISRAILATVFFVFLMPVLACGGFFLMMHGVNEASDMIATAGLICIPLGWIALYVAFKSDFLI